MRNKAIHMAHTQRRRVQKHAERLFQSMYGRGRLMPDFSLDEFSDLFCECLDMAMAIVNRKVERNKHGIIYHISEPLFS